MAGEELARRVVEKELGCTVTLNDDNSKPGMYDLRIGAPETPDVAIECVGAVDSTFTETWNIGPAQGPLNLQIAGDWNVTISRDARIKMIRRRIGLLLKELEMRGIYSFRRDHWLKRGDRQLFDELESLGIEAASCYRVEGTGEVHLGPPGIGGVVDKFGSTIPSWISDFLSARAQLDVLGKLRQSGAKSCHVFVIVTFAGAPWSVESYLTGDLDKLPSQRPHLPAPVNEVWIVHDLGQRGVRWNGETWRGFNARGEGIEGKPSD